jgi:hypothetical protein
VLHVGHAAEAIAAGKCRVALITLAGRPRAEGMARGTAPRNYGTAAPDVQSGKTGSASAKGVTSRQLGVEPAPRPP